MLKGYSDMKKEQKRCEDTQILTKKIKDSC